MGFKLNINEFNNVLEILEKKYVIYAPKVSKNKGHFSDTNLVKYEEIINIEEIEFEEKSRFSFKEVLTPITEILFYFTEENTTVPKENKKGAIIFVRSCDMHAVKRLDEIYLKNGVPDFYYDRIRKNVKFVLMGCEKSYSNCFCVDMGCNKTDEYDFSVEIKDGCVLVDSKDSDINELLKGKEQLNVIPRFVTENDIRVELPDEVGLSLFESDIWEEYNQRCISCGRCNFVCPTCTCYTMQDVFYEDNGRVGERRRVWASCHIDGYTEMAGGHSFRQKKSQRMRFKVLHKVYDYKKRFGYNMCVGCGRCDDACPEYISFSNSINKLTKASKEAK